jgi:hypothetical protein
LVTGFAGVQEACRRQMVMGFAGIKEPLVITHNGGDLGCDFVISATPTKAKRQTKQP